MRASVVVSANTATDKDKEKEQELVQQGLGGQQMPQGGRQTAQGHLEKSRPGPDGKEADRGLNSATALKVSASTLTPSERSQLRAEGETVGTEAPRDPGEVARDAATLVRKPDLGGPDKKIH